MQEFECGKKLVRESQIYSQLDVDGANYTYNELERSHFITFRLYVNGAIPFLCLILCALYSYSCAIYTLHIIFFLKKAVRLYDV